MAREQLKNLTEPMYYVLLSLIRENHGYGIMQMISELTEGRVAVGAGTLYSLLGRFEKEKIIDQIAEENRRKIYRLTEKGQGILDEEFERLNKMVSDGRKFMGCDGERPVPPSDLGSGLTMPVVEESAVNEEQEETERENEQEKEVHPQADEVPDDEAPQEEKKRRKGFGGFGKGVLMPT